jgi:fructosamine-3-kinase
MYYPTNEMGSNDDLLMLGGGIAHIVHYLCQQQKYGFDALSEAFVKIHSLVRYAATLGLCEEQWREFFASMQVRFYAFKFRVQISDDLEDRFDRAVWHLVCLDDGGSCKTLGVLFLHGVVAMHPTCRVNSRECHMCIKATYRAAKTQIYMSYVLELV